MEYRKGVDLNLLNVYLEMHHVLLRFQGLRVLNRICLLTPANSTAVTWQLYRNYVRETFGLNSKIKTSLKIGNETSGFYTKSYIFLNGHASWMSLKECA